jgi:hypothetical protein
MVMTHDHKDSAWGWTQLGGVSPEVSVWKYLEVFEGTVLVDGIELAES